MTLTDLLFELTRQHYVVTIDTVGGELRFMVSRDEGSQSRPQSRSQEFRFSRAWASDDTIALELELYCRRSGIISVQDN